MAKDELLEARLTDSIIGAFYEVYNRLGYGFFEKTYAKALAIELGYKGHDVRQEVGVDLYYKGHHVGRQRIDLLVDDRVIIEVKAAEVLSKAAYRQCYSYLRSTSLRVGLVFHFGPEPRIKRIVSDGRSLGPNTEIVFPLADEPGDDQDATGVPA
jgi:GxxExxY protein